MAWMQQLQALYDANIDEVGEFSVRHDQRFTLLPVAHMTQGMQVTITVTREGDFYKAEVVPKEEAQTITPMTLDSANRSGSKVAPHYIHDKLFYVAGDYAVFSTDKNRNDNFNVYLKQMEQWADSAYSHPKVKAIKNYVAKRRVIQDLIEAGLICTYPDGKIVEKWDNSVSRILNMDKPELYQLLQQTIFDIGVRFNVLKSDPTERDVWEDSELFDLFIRYTNEVLLGDKPKVLCYATGDYGIPTSQHSKKIRNAGDNAKLISANDKSGYTYRGKWENPDEAVQISYLASQKAHHALRWLIQRQGSFVDSRYFVVFRKFGDTVTDVFASSYDLLASLDGFGDHAVDGGARQGTGMVEAEQVSKALQGFAHSFDSKFFDQTIIMALDAATTGRLSIVYYQEVDSRLYLDNLEYWHETCRWIHHTRDENKQAVSFIGAPATYLIARGVYGEKADARLKKELYTRLLPCIVERQAIPKDIVYTIFERVKNPESFKNTTESWKDTVNIACALINKMYEKEGLDVALDKDNKSRDYLFGRLLGIAEVMESRILKDQNENRSTNATRYFNAFANRPARTWLVIRKQLQPYFSRMGKRATFYQMLIQEVEASIGESGMNDKALSPLFLIGYSSQVQDLYKKKEVDQDDNIEE